MFRMLPAILFAVVSAASPSEAQTSAPQEIIDMAHASFQKAATPDAIESIATWCRNSLSTFSLKERERLMRGAAASIRKNSLDEANEALKRVKEIEALDKKVADLNCKPNSMDDAARRGLKPKIKQR